MDADITHIIHNIQTIIYLSTNPILIVRAFKFKYARWGLTFPD
jgi:hypothetical protein